MPISTIQTSPTSSSTSAYAQSQAAANKERAVVPYVNGIQQTLLRAFTATQSQIPAIQNQINAFVRCLINAGAESRKTESQHTISSTKLDSATHSNPTANPKCFERRSPNKY